MKRLPKFSRTNKIKKSSGIPQNAGKLVVSKSKGSQTKETRKESWVNYADLDFCEACWKKLEFSKWVKK